MKRRPRDSNPRYGFPYTHFPGVPLQPLEQVSGRLRQSFGNGARVAKILVRYLETE